MDAFIRETINNIDELATHHSIEEVYTDSIHVVEIDAEMIRYEATGTVGVELQWGSSSDFRRGDGATSDQSFPFRCTTAAPVDQPYNFYTELTEVMVNTSKWYKD